VSGFGLVGLELGLGLELGSGVRVRVKGQGSRVRVKGKGLGLWSDHNLHILGIETPRVKVRGSG
jgi:hypothetical protein